MHHRYRTDPLREETARLRSEVDRCRDAVQALDDEDAAEQARLAFLGHLSEAAATALARAVSFGRAGHDDLGQDGRSSVRRHRGRARPPPRNRRAQPRRPPGTRSRRAAPGRRGRAGPTVAVAFAEVSAALEASAATRAEVELSYHVPGASWRPLYDLALDGERLAVSYLAEVTQQTGEDWPAVELVLSTTRRGLHQTLPELDPWYIGRAQPVRRPLAGRSMAVAAGGSSARRGVAHGCRTGRSRRADAGLEEAAPLAAEPGESGAGLVYRVQRPLAVPADGGPHKTMVARFELDAALDHLAVPVLAPEAYLRATVTNTSPLLLLPGPARVFHDTAVRRGDVPGDRRRGRGVRAAARGGRPDQGGTRAAPPEHQQGRDRGHPHDRRRLRDHGGKSPPGQGPGKRARPHPGVHGRRYQGPAARDQPEPGRARMTWASSHGICRLTAARQRRSATGSPSSIPAQVTVAGL